MSKEQKANDSIFTKRLHLSPLDSIKRNTRLRNHQDKKSNEKPKRSKPKETRTINCLVPDNIQKEENPIPNSNKSIKSISFAPSKESLSITPELIQQEDEKKIEETAGKENNNFPKESIKNGGKSVIKKKKDWKSWSHTEKQLFYEAIASGANVCSLQKLFKNMNDKIGTKSTEKIRDYYYRALRNVNKLLKSIGCDCVNRKNRDEVLLALNCYGKILSNKLKKNNLVYIDKMKNLNKHPRLFKKTALTLKKLITNKIKLMRTKKKISSKVGSKPKSIAKSLNNCNSKKESKSLAGNHNQNINTSSGTNNNYNQKRIINLEDYRNIPFKKFSLRLFPANSESYCKMIEGLYVPRIELQVSYNRSLSSIVEILSDKWNKISKKYKNCNLSLLPITCLWIGKINSEDNFSSYDIGDIYTGYGKPNTNTIYMQYLWNENRGNPVNNNPVPNPNSNKNKELQQKSNELDQCNSMFVHQASQLNSLQAKPNLESDEEKEKSINSEIQEYEDFDPLEFLGIYNENQEKKNSSENSENDDNEIEITDKNENEIKDLEVEANYRRKSIDESNTNLKSNFVKEKEKQFIDFSCMSQTNSIANNTLNNFNSNFEIFRDKNKSNTNLNSVGKKEDSNNVLPHTPNFSNNDGKMRNVEKKRIKFCQMSPNDLRKTMADESIMKFNNISNSNSRLNVKKSDTNNLSSPTKRNPNTSTIKEPIRLSNHEIETKKQSNLMQNQISNNPIPVNHSTKLSNQEVSPLKKANYDVYSFQNKGELSNLLNNENSNMFNNNLHFGGYNFVSFFGEENSLLNYKNNYNSNIPINDGMLNSNLSHFGLFQKNDDHIKKPLITKNYIENDKNQNKNENEELLSKKKSRRKNVKESTEKSAKKVKKEEEKEKTKKSAKSETKTPIIQANQKVNNIPLNSNEGALNYQPIYPANPPYIINQNNYYSNSFENQRSLSQNYVGNMQNSIYNNINIEIPLPQNLFYEEKQNKMFVQNGFNNYPMENYPLIMNNSRYYVMGPQNQVQQKNIKK